jgi:hypothetical protein
MKSKLFRITSLLLITLSSIIVNAQTKEEIGQWLVDSLKIKTIINKTSNNGYHDKNLFSFIEYLPNINNGVFIIYKAISFNAGENGTLTNIYVIKKDDLVWQKTSELKFFMPT